MSPAAAVAVGRRFPDNSALVLTTSVRSPGAHSSPAVEQKRSIEQQQPDAYLSRPAVPAISRYWNTHCITAVLQHKYGEPKTLQVPESAAQLAVVRLAGISADTEPKRPCCQGGARRPPPRRQAEAVLLLSAGDAGRARPAREAEALSLARGRGRGGADALVRADRRAALPGAARRVACLQGRTQDAGEEGVD